MTTEKFFEDPKEQSVVKTTIVEKYFHTWASIIIGAQKLNPYASDKIGYVDLFAGPGRYEDGSDSTPLRVLRKAIDDEKLRSRLVTIFNDRDAKHAGALQEAIDSLEGIGNLKYKPVVWNEEVGDGITKEFASMDKIPMLAFIDPWGYKGLTLSLVSAFLKDWGSDCILFFNYNRINPGLSNDAVRQHMRALFGEQRAEQLRHELHPMKPHQREATIVNALACALKDFGGRFVLPFCFKDDNGKRTTHHLVLVTKHFRGYEKMKGIMARTSSSSSQGVPSFTFCPADSEEQELLFELNRPLDDLEEMLLTSFAGQTLTTREIYEQHSVDLPYIMKNYKDVLANLEKNGVILVKGRKSNRGFADDIIVTFPSRKK